jgi:protein-tyrosine phosphatase
VLLICTENTCRSPLAEALLRARLRERGLGRRVRVGSAGTRTSRPGRRPDARALRLLQEQEIGSRGLRARQVTVRDIARSDGIFAMDAGHMQALGALCPPDQLHKLSLLRGACGLRPVEIPDPYYGSVEQFREVYVLIDEAVTALADSLAVELDAPAPEL